MNEYTVYLTVAIDVPADNTSEAEEKARGLLRDVGVSVVDGTTEVACTYIDRW